MRRILTHLSLAAQIIFLVTLCLVLSSTAALLSLRGVSEAQRLQLMLALLLASLLGLGLAVAAVCGLLRPLRSLKRDIERICEGELPQTPVAAMPNRELSEIRTSFEQMVHRLRQAQSEQQTSQAALAARGRTMDHLLEFSQTIQGAGQAEQVYSALAHFLQNELGLAGLIVITHEEGALPSIQCRIVRPESILNLTHPVAEMDPAHCPCLRQNMARHFEPHATPVRCSVEQSLLLSSEHPAYCIPFHIGRKFQGVVHMALPIGATWTPELRQLAQTYVNTANSSLISLHLLEEAEQQSMTDSLTGLYNRHSMDRLLQREVALAERHDHALSLVMVDLDFFKQINDVHGHAAGDHLLHSFADCVRMTLRKTDLAFRYGGDEFLIVLPQTPVAQAQQVVQKLRQAFAAADFTHAITGLESQPTLSIGVAERSKAANTLTVSSLVSAADQALYEAKSANRNCVRVYQPPRAA